MNYEETADELAREAARVVNSVVGFADESPKRAFELARADALSRGAVAIRQLLVDRMMNDVACGSCACHGFRLDTMIGSVIVCCVVCGHRVEADSLGAAVQHIAIKVNPLERLRKGPRTDANEPLYDSPAPEGGYSE